MRISARQLAFVLAPPLLSVALLGGIVAEQHKHLKPEDVEPYHARARDGIAKVPFVVGYWTGKDETIPVAAQRLLRPNAILSRTYVDNEIISGGPRHRSASVLIVQCRDSRDMVGHYPPICYRAHGMTMDPNLCGPRDWKIDGTTISGYEYHFTQLLQGQTTRTTVYNFLIIPGRGIVRDMKGVAQAAEDYQQRYYGAAQFQVVFHGLAATERSQPERDEIFATLMGPNLSLIKTLVTLTPGGLQ